MMDDPYEPYHDAPRSTWRTPVVFILILLAAGFAGWYFWPKTGDKSAHQASVVVTTTPALREDVPVYMDGLGTIQAYNTVTVHTQEAGYLTKVLFREGQDVHASDVLAEIDPRTFQAQYDQAVGTRDKDAATLENAKRDLTRYENLGTDISGQTLDTQRSLVNQLEATVRADDGAIENAKTLLAYTRITSPIDGRTGIRQVDVGNLVQPGDANGIVVVTQLQPISVIFSLPQQDLQPINASINAAGNQKLTALALGQDGKTIVDTGVLELVDNEIDQTTGTIKLKATFPNKDHMLWPGGFTNVRLMVSTQPGVLVIPSVAVQRGPQGSYVFALQPDKTVKIRVVTVGTIQGDTSVITGGITDGEQIVTDGMIKLQDGSKVALASDPKPDVAPGAAPPADDKKHKHHKNGQDQGTPDKTQ